MSRWGYLSVFKKAKSVMEHCCDGVPCQSSSYDVVFPFIFYIDIQYLYGISTRILYCVRSYTVCIRRVYVINI